MVRKIISINGIFELAFTEDGVDVNYQFAPKSLHFTKREALEIAHALLDHFGYVVHPEKASER